MRRARKGSGVISLRFNQDQGCFTCCMDTGLRIYNVDPLAEKAHYTREEIGDVVICEMLYRSNILFMVRSSQDKVLQVYDDAKSTFIAEVTFNGSIRAVRLRKDRIAVVLEQCIQLMRWPALTRSGVVATPPNIQALCALPTAPSPQHMLLAAPGHKLGSVQLVDLQNQACTVSLPPHHVHCHRGLLASLAMSANGSLMATASSRGTLIRIWDLPKGHALVELRRGADQSTLYCLSFSWSGELVCCVSDKGTLHVWSVRSPSLNRRSSLASALGGLGGAGAAYAASQWALATAALPPDTPTQCALLRDTAVVAVCKDGSYHKYIFSQDGSCRRDSYDIFLQVGDDDDFIV